MAITQRRMSLEAFLALPRFALRVQELFASLMVD